MQIGASLRRRLRTRSIGAVMCATMLAVASPVSAQRLLGIDISAHQDNLSASNWTTLHTTNSRDFVFIRASRGGTTGFDHGQDNFSLPNADCNGVSTNSCLSRRYDDPYFGQNITLATNAGLFAGPYHRTRADIVTGTANSSGIANTGTDDANHFIQMAGAWMRPGYLPPVMDFEDGQSQRTAEQLAQFCLDFSNQIYSVMGIRPVMYINGSYANTTLGSEPSSVRDQLAQPSANGPSVVAPAFPTLWTARYPNGSGNLYTGNIQTDQPDNTVSTVYGPWDDYGSAHPWAFWQYSSGERLSGYSLSSNIDADVSQGDLEYLKDHLVPALWWNDTSGDWSALANWNSGQTPVAPVVGANQSPVQGTTILPTARLPGATGSGPTSGQNDTVILERQNANITVTLSTGTHNIRKLYMREALNITGGSLTINYDPNYVSDTVNYPNALRSGPISAQFSGPVSLGGSGNLNVNTLQVDASQTFTLAGSSGTLTFKQINLLSSAKIGVTGDVNINPLSNATATISGSSGNVDLSGGTRIFNVGNGTSDVDLDVASPIINGGLTKNGAGTMRLSGSNTFTGPVTVNAGVLRSNNATGFSSISVITVNNGGTLDMNGIADTVASLGGTSGGIITQGAAGLTVAATSGTNTFAGTITGTGTFTKSGGATQVLSGNNSLGAVALNAGSLLFNGTNTTGAVTVASGATLGGTGSVTGAVTVNGGGRLAPGASIESLGVGALTLNAGSVLDIELAAPGTSDLINVSGLLTLGSGSVNLINLGIDAGTYTLINYGTLSGNVTNLGTPIGGPSNFNYKLVDTGSAINLSVTIPGDFILDGMVDAADYVVWRKGLGTSYTPIDGAVWRANFGRAAGSGSGASLGGAANIPEPTTALLIVCGAMPFIGRRNGTTAGTRQKSSRLIGPTYCKCPVA
jgi:autotransporter-associated beta strand protein